VLVASIGASMPPASLTEASAASQSHGPNVPSEPQRCAPARPVEQVHAPDAPGVHTDTVAAQDASASASSAARAVVRITPDYATPAGGR
jgi:hypothetical protein